MFGAGYRVTGHKLRRQPAEPLSDRGNNRGLHAADIGDRLGMIFEPHHPVRYRRRRYREQNGAGGRQRRIRLEQRVDQALAERRSRVFAVGVDAHHPAKELVRLHRPRKRAADQPCADHHEHVGIGQRMCSRVARKRSFSSFVPTVTRRCPGSSYSATGRTITPACNSLSYTPAASATATVRKLPAEGM